MRLLDFLTRLREKSGPSCAGEIRPSDELWEAVDLVVKLSHPNIHYAPHYRKKLRPAVEHTLQYADELIGRLPAPVSVDADSWNKDPFIRTAFADSRQFRDFFSDSTTLKDFFQKQKASRCCALLVMNREDKKMFGVQMEGEIVKRDVLQVSINFSDHQIVAPMMSEAETRKELSLRMLALLASHALKDILSLIEWNKAMEQEKRILEMKLHLQSARDHSQEALFPESPDTAGATEESEVLEQLNRKIAEVRTEIDEPEDYLNKVAGLLYHPEQFLRSEPVHLLVNDMNLLVEKDNRGKVEEIRFVEFRAGKKFRKAGVLVDYRGF